jgi:hypothetical protein
MEPQAVSRLPALLNHHLSFPQNSGCLDWKMQQLSRTDVSEVSSVDLHEVFPDIDASCPRRQVVFLSALATLAVSTLQ